MKKLSKEQIRKLILKELESMGEDVLKPFPQGKEKHHTPPLGSSSGRLKTHSCSVHGTMYEKDCLECGSMYEEKEKEINEGAYGCNSNSKASMIENSYPFSTHNLAGDLNIDYKGIIQNILGMHSSGHDHFSKKHSKKSHGSYMAKSQLYQVHKYAQRLYEIIPEGYNLEDWMRSKISQIADDISEVYHALDHDKYKGDI